MTPPTTIILVYENGSFLGYNSLLTPLSQCRAQSLLKTRMPEVDLTLQFKQAQITEFHRIDTLCYLVQALVYTGYLVTLKGHKGEKRKTSHFLPPSRGTFLLNYILQMSRVFPKTTLHTFFHIKGTVTFPSNWKWGRMVVNCRERKFRYTWSCLAQGLSQWLANIMSSTLRWVLPQNSVLKELSVC